MKVSPWKSVEQFKYYIMELPSTIFKPKLEK